MSRHIRKDKPQKGMMLSFDSILVVSVSIGQQSPLCLESDRRHQQQLRDRMLQRESAIRNWVDFRQFGVLCWPGQQRSAAMSAVAKPNCTAQ